METLTSAFFIDGLANLHLTLTLPLGHTQGHAQGHAHFNSKYFANDDRQGSITILPSTKLNAFDCRIDILASVHSKGQGRGFVHDTEIVNSGKIYNIFTIDNLH